MSSSGGGLGVKSPFSRREHLYDSKVTALQQQALDNLVSDVLLGAVLLVISTYGLYRLAKLWEASVLPLFVLLPSFVCAGLVLHTPLGPLYGPSDGGYYQQWGLSLAAAWLAGEPMVHPEAIWPGKGVWPLIIAGFATIAGPVTITLVVFNALIVSLSVIVLQRATFMVSGMSPRWSMVFVFLSSSPFLIFGPSLLREALFWMGVAYGVLALSYASAHRYLSALSAVGLSTLVLLGIRPSAGIVIVYGFVAMLILFLGIVGRKPSWLRVLGTSVALLTLALTFPTALDSVREGVGVHTVETSNRALAKEGVTTAFGPSSDPSEPWCKSEFSVTSLGATALCRALMNLPYALFGPFHWEYGPEPIWLISGASTLHFLVLAGLAAYYVVASRGHRWSLLVMLAAAALSMLMWSTLLTNYGILIRFRAATEIMLVPIALSGALQIMSKVTTRKDGPTSMT